MRGRFTYKNRWDKRCGAMNKYKYTVEYLRLYKNGDSNNDFHSFNTYEEAKQYACDLIDNVVSEYSEQGYDITENVVDDRYSLIAGSYDIIIVVKIISKPYEKYVYILKTTEAYNCTVIDTDVRVFNSKERALEVMNEIIADLVSNSRFYENGVLLDKYTAGESEDGEDGFVIKELDSYDNGIEVSISKVELEG